MKKVLFDVDGVLLSEERYFDVSALVVWEWYFGTAYMNLGGEVVQSTVTDEEIKKIRQRFWRNDDILNWLKGHGINSNWDMVHAHIAVITWLLLEAYGDRYHDIPAVRIDSNEDIQDLGKILTGLPFPTATEVLERLERCVSSDAGKDEVFCQITAAAVEGLGPSGQSTLQWMPLDSSLWKLHQACFQGWYLGDDIYKKIYGQATYVGGKDGFLHREVPLGTVKGIRSMFRTLKERGYDIGIATGRWQVEMEEPFKTFHWLSEFNPYDIATATDVETAEAKLHVPLGKPHPFTYYVAALGNHPERYDEYADKPKELLTGDTYYVVGDSLSDIWAAKEMGAVMVGTLTGLNGLKARAMFEKEEVPYILDTVEDILQILP